MGMNDPTDGGGQAPPAIDWATKYREQGAELEKVRREAAGYRTGHKGVLAEVAKALGLDPSKPDFDPSQVAATVTAKNEEIRALKVRAPLAEAFSRHGVKNHGVARAYLIDSGAMSRFDPSAADLDEVIEDAITELLESNPELRGTRPAGKSGPEWPGGPGQNPTPAYTREEIAALGATNPEEVVRLRRAGRLGHLTNPGGI